MDTNLLLQIAGIVLGLLYLWLEYRADIRLWIVGLAMPAVHGVLYYKAGLYADCSMQVCYVLAGLYGWLVWLAVDAVTVGLYLYQGIPLTAGLYALYTVLAAAGYLRWRRMAAR